MSLFFAMLVAAQAAPAAIPVQAPAAAPAPVQSPVKVKKPKANCTWIDVTGSHSRQRVCAGDDPNLALSPGLSHSTTGLRDSHQSAGVDGSRGGLSSN